MTTTYPTSHICNFCDFPGDLVGWVAYAIAKEERAEIISDGVRKGTKRSKILDALKQHKNFALSPDGRKAYRTRANEKLDAEMTKRQHKKHYFFRGVFETTLSKALISIIAIGVLALLAFSFQKTECLDGDRSSVALCVISGFLPDRDDR